jgi:hypothetical protein
MKFFAFRLPIQIQFSGTERRTGRQYSSRNGGLKSDPGEFLTKFSAWKGGRDQRRIYRLRRSGRRSRIVRRRSGPTPRPDRPGNKTSAKLIGPGRRLRSIVFRARCLDAVDDLAEHVADCGTKDRQNDNDHDGDKNQDQRILYKTLAFPLQFLEHGFFLLSLRM